MIALLAPGQGAQTPGMLRPWLELDGVESRLSAWSELTGLDLLRLGTTADEEEVKDTAVAQPLLVALSLIGLEQLHGQVRLSTEHPVAGHSVGELAAAAAAGVLSPDDAVRLAAVRGQEMAAACALEPTGMSAVLGGDPNQVLRHLDALGLETANRNGGGQVVAAGHRSALEELAAQPPDNARVRPLPVAGAFHTRFMAPARDAFAQHAATVEPATPKRPLLSNADGAVVSDPNEIMHRLTDQIARPVYWDACMATLNKLGVDAVVELPPAGTLAGMVRRELKGTRTLAYKAPEHLETVVEAVSSDNSRSAT